MPRAITARHDGIVQLVAAIFRRAGALVNIEVKCDGETRVRPDIEIILPDHSILVDVAVVHPSAPSRRSLTPLAATRDIENAKAAKYSSVASERGARFMAFIVESYGALGKQAMELLKLLHKMSSTALRLGPLNSLEGLLWRPSLLPYSVAMPSYPTRAASLLVLKLYLFNRTYATRHII